MDAEPKKMLYCNLERTRWFMVPVGTELPEGPLEVQDMRRENRKVSEEAIAAHEVDRETARAYVDGLLEDPMARMGTAYQGVLRALNPSRDGSGEGEPLTLKDVLGASPGELYTDSSKGKEVAERVFGWMSGRVSPRAGEPGSDRPDLGDVLRRVGEGLQVAAERLRAAQAEQEARRQAQAADRAAGVTRVERLGRFRELDDGEPEDPSLRSAIRDAAGPHQAEIVAYLRAGHLLLASSEPAIDAIAPERGPIGTHALHTDGRFAWRQDLAYYVERYHLRLPESFLAHVIGNGFEVPGDVDVTRLVI